MCPSIVNTPPHHQVSSKSLSASKVKDNFGPTNAGCAGRDGATVWTRIRQASLQAAAIQRQPDAPALHNSRHSPVFRLGEEDSRVSDDSLGRSMAWIFGAKLVEQGVSPRPITRGIPVLSCSIQEAEEGSRRGEID